MFAQSHLEFKLFQAYNQVSERSDGNVTGVVFLWWWSWEKEGLKSGGREWNKKKLECHQNIFWQSNNILVFHFPFRLVIQLFFGMQVPYFALSFWHLACCYFAPWGGGGGGGEGGREGGEILVSKDEDGKNKTLLIQSKEELDSRKLRKYWWVCRR